MNKFLSFLRNDNQVSGKSSPFLFHLPAPFYMSLFELQGDFCQHIWHFATPVSATGHCPPQLSLGYELPCLVKSHYFFHNCLRSQFITREEAKALLVMLQRTQLRCPSICFIRNQLHSKAKFHVLNSFLIYPVCFTD